MLSKTTDVTVPPSARTIFINPNFRQPTQLLNDVVTTAHFNPLFLQNRIPAPPPPSIHMNPQFFQKKLLEQQLLMRQQELQDESIKQTVQMVPPPSQLPTNAQVQVANDVSRKIIAKSRTRLVREPVPAVPNSKKLPETRKPVVQPLISLNKRKLVRRPAASVVAPCAIAEAKQLNKVSKSTVSPTAKYKVDHRTLRPKNICNSGIPLLKLKRRDFVARYALRRVANQLTTENINVKSSAAALKPSLLSANRKLSLLKINGVLYKSTGNKLQRKDTINTSSATGAAIKTKSRTTQKLPTGRTLFVHGTKFVMDSQGYRLTRMPNTSLTKEASPTISATKQRLDIGGLTYIASKTQNVFVRSSNHLALAHVNSAKQRSVQMLSRRFVKSNVPCAIFQRVGKCVAHERGRCNKVHDKRQVTICSRFLRSDCHNPNCLLSHNVSLSKMPVCKFFLQGMCVRKNCPYLHKKLSQKVGICEDFLRGFCKLAEQCNKRHEFLCPEFERNGRCELTNCIHCKSKKRQQKRSEEASARARKEQVSPQPPPEAEVAPTRYFTGNSVQPTAAALEAPTTVDSDSDVEIIEEPAASDVKFSRRQIGTLPAFIPLS